jgi:hypothetical protein
VSSGPDPEGAILALAVLTAAYNKELPRETLEIYVNLLQHHPRQYLMAAAERLVTTSRWFPTVAEVGETVCRVSDPFPAPSPEEAWVEVISAARSRGRDDRPPWTHPAVGAALDVVGGYRHLCDQSDAYLGMTRREYHKQYESLIQRTWQERALTPSLSEGPPSWLPPALD